MGRIAVARLSGVSFGVVVLFGAAALGGCGALLGDFNVDDSAFQDGGSGLDATVGGDAAADAGGRGDTGPVPTEAGLDAADAADAPSACVGESDAELCAAASKDCDGIIAKDKCGASRVITTCGTCGAPKTCGTAQPNVCGCKPETDAQLCTRNGKNCGQLTAADNCGAQRTVASCGACPTIQTCGPKVANLCGDPICTPETNTAFCNRYGKNCDALSASDNCGTPRIVQSCGTCMAPQKCGALTAGICGCTAESDASFCARIGHTCGRASGTDNCGAPRNVANCGTCSSSNTCTAAGVCGCNSGPACTGGSTCCAGAGCFDFSNDPNNCGGCGKSCGGGNGWACAPGAQCSCTGGSMLCKGLCSRMHTNELCTACGDVCATGKSCCLPPRLEYWGCYEDATCGLAARGSQDTSRMTPPTTSRTESIDTRE